MRKLLYACILLAATSSLLAQSEMLLAPNGTFYTIDSVTSDDHPEVGSSASHFLMFTMRHGDVEHEGVIPGTLLPGTHTEPAITYDSESKRLFVFWRYSRTLAESELLFSSLDENGEWSEPTGIDKAALRYRQNFRIGITRKTEVIDEDGKHTVVPETNVHAIWWDSGDREGARYAMLTIQNGDVTSSFVSNLEDIVADGQPYVVNDPPSELMKTTAVVETPGRETIELVYGDPSTNTIRRLRLKPVIDVRIRIPIGVKDSITPSPKFDIASNEHAFTLPGDGASLVVGATSDGNVRYRSFDGESWSEERSLALSNKLTKTDAMSVIHRMANSK